VGLLLLLLQISQCRPSKQYRPILEILGAASASARSLTATGGGGSYQLKMVGDVQKKVEGVNPPEGCRKISEIIIS